MLLMVSFSSGIQNSCAADTLSAQCHPIVMGYREMGYPKRIGALTPIRDKMQNHSDKKWFAVFVGLFR